MSYVLPDNAMTSKILYIDSRDASSYLSHNTTTGKPLNSYFQYVLKENIEIPGNQRALISLNSATIPYSFYNIREGINDVLDYAITNMSNFESETGKVEIPAGNYTAYTLIPIIVDKINTSQNATKEIEFTFAMEYDSDAQKYLYKFNSKGDSVGDQLVLQFLFRNKDLISPHIEMGFDAIDVEIKSELTDAVKTTKSDNVVDINGSIHGVYIRTNLVSDGTLDSQNGTFSNILARMPINVQSGGIIFATPNNATHKSKVDLRSISILTIRLTDERNRILDLNGLHFQLAIAIDFIYGKRAHQVPQGALGENTGHSFAGDEEMDNVYGVVGEDKTKQIQAFRQAQAKAKEEEDKRPPRARRVGRPRNVGRPRGSRNQTKITEETEDE
jgi:hypothetical protein